METDKELRFAPFHVESGEWHYIGDLNKQYIHLSVKIVPPLPAETKMMGRLSVDASGLNKMIVFSGVRHPEHAYSADFHIRGKLGVIVPIGIGMGRIGNSSLIFMMEGMISERFVDFTAACGKNECGRLMMLMRLGEMPTVSIQTPGEASSSKSVQKASTSPTAPSDIQVIVRDYGKAGFKRLAHGSLDANGEWKFEGAVGNQVVAIRLKAIPPVPVDRPNLQFTASLVAGPTGLAMLGVYDPAGDAEGRIQASKLNTNGKISCAVPLCCCIGDIGGSKFILGITVAENMEIFYNGHTAKTEGGALGHTIDFRSPNNNHFPDGASTSA